MNEIKKGDRVRHPIYGYGTAIVMIPCGEKSDIPKVTVMFDSGMRQTFALQYAPLQPLTKEELTAEQLSIAESHLRHADAPGPETIINSIKSADAAESPDAAAQRSPKDASIEPYTEEELNAERLKVKAWCKQNVGTEEEWRRLQNETFTKEPPATKHFYGAHWPPFMADSIVIIKQFPDIIGKSVLAKGFADDARHAPPYAAPENWPTGFYLAWPKHGRGLLLEIQPQSDKNTLETFFPYVGVGDSSEHTLTLERVIVCENGLEAQIEATLGGAAIYFYDTLFSRNRGWYIAGKQYQFALAGIAYACARAKDEIIKTSFNPKMAEALKDIPAWSKAIAAGEMELHTEGMALFVPVKDWDKDEYEFRGTIKAVTPLEMLEQRCWRIRTTVIRDGDNADIDLDIIVTQKVWGDNIPPSVGEDIKGTLWLQGELSNVKLPE